MSLSTEREKGAHLLRRFGLGASEAELDYYLKDGLKGAVNKLLDPPADPGSVIDLELFRNTAGIPMPQIVNAWVMRIAATRRPLEERMTLFWHNHFATSHVKVESGMMMIGQNETLRANALGTFPKMLEAISKDPAMLVWLDNQDNVKGNPNENFAREVMELFTLGVDNYTEEDVREAARAFTGWAFRRGGKGGGPASFLFRANLHDDGSKTFLTKTGPFNGEDILKILCEQPRTSLFLTRKLWEWFVWPNPDMKTIEPFAERFRKSGLDIKSLLRDVMNSEEFYSAKAQRSLVKSPVDFVIATVRQLGIGEQLRNPIQSKNVRRAVPPAFAAKTSMAAMGMDLMNPPDVSGWKPGNDWITTSTIVTRVSWADRIFGQEKNDAKFSAVGLFPEEVTAEEAVKKMLSLYDVTLSPQREAILLKAVEKESGGKVTAENANKVVHLASRLIFATPEFQSY